MKMTTAVFDIDGTIADDRWRRILINWFSTNPDERYESYHSGLNEDELINKHLVEACHQEGDVITFATSRPERYFARTQKWLQQKFKGLEFNLIMRPDDDHSPSPELKLRMLEDLSEQYDVCAVYDDREDVCAMLLDNGYDAVHITTCGNGPEEGNWANPPPLGAIEDDSPRPATRETPNERSAPLRRPDEVLTAAAKTFLERNTLYKDNYLQFGRAMAHIFPEGLTVQTPEEWNRLGIFVQCAAKMTRYAANMEHGGHGDSAHDLAVYAAMLETLTK